MGLSYGLGSLGYGYGEFLFILFSDFLEFLNFCIFRLQWTISSEKPLSGILKTSKIRGQKSNALGEAKPGGFQTRGFPTFFGKVQIVSRTLSGLFLVGALNRPRKRKRTNRENPRTILDFFSEIEHFKRATRQTPILFCGEFGMSRLKF